MKKPLISIIIPTFNSEKFIKESLDSAINQTYRNIEIIIIDDNSTDKTESLIKNFKWENTAYIYIKNKFNIGAASSRNIGIRVAKGEYIAFLDSDDKWLPEKLEKQLDFMEKTGSYISCTSYFKINEKSQRYQLVNPPDLINYSRLLRSCPIGCLTVMYNVRLLGKVFFDNRSKREDYLTWLTLSKKICQIDVIKKPLAEYRTYKNQSSANKIKMAKENWKIYREIENLNIIKSVFYFTNYAFIGIWNTYKSKIFKIK